MSPKSYSRWLIIGSGLAVALAAVGWLGSDVWLASTQWLLVAICLGIFGLWLKLEK